MRADSTNAAQVSSFNCEVTAHRHLLDEWAQQKRDNPGLGNRYLDTLSDVQQAGFLSEYVVRFFRQEDWQLPQELRPYEFRKWSAEHLVDHFPRRYMTGEWIYATEEESQ